MFSPNQINFCLALHKKKYAERYEIYFDKQMTKSEEMIVFCFCSPTTNFAFYVAYNPETGQFYYNELGVKSDTYLPNGTRVLRYIWEEFDYLNY